MIRLCTLGLCEWGISAFGVVKGEGWSGMGVGYRELSTGMLAVRMVLGKLADFLTT